MQGVVKPVSAAIAGEDPSGSVAAMRRRGKPKYIEAGLGISESRDWTAPIGPVFKLFSFF